MEFKGTEGPWSLANNDYGYYTSVRSFDRDRKICVSRVNNIQESNANLLLISKAPEMLEMLKEVLAGRIHPQEYQSDWDIVDELIKSATEG